MIALKSTHSLLLLKIIAMASITIRKLDDDVKIRLRVRAAENRRSMEEEARLILRDAVSDKSTSRNLGEVVQSIFGPNDRVDLQLPPRELVLLQM